MLPEQQQTIIDTAKVAPPIAVSALEAGGTNLPDLALWLTIIYTGLMIVQHIWTKWWVPIRNDRRRRARQKRGLR